MPERISSALLPTRRFVCAFIAALIAFAGIPAVGLQTAQAADVQGAVTYSSYSFGTTYREAAFGDAPNGVASTEGCHFVINATYPGELTLSSAEEAAASITLDGSSVMDATVSSISVSGNVLTLDATSTYMPGGVITVSAASIDGVTCEGAPVSWPSMTTIVPTGLKFHVTDVTVGTKNTCASTTVEIDHSANIRSMNHILWTSNGSSILSGTGAAQTTVAHHHNYWGFTLQTSAEYIQEYANGLSGYVVELTEDGYGVTIRATTPTPGEYLGIYNYDDDFLQAAGLTLADHVMGLPPQEPSTSLSLPDRANIAVGTAEYTGQPVQPQVIVNDGRYGTLVEGRDYSLSYSSNTEYGTGQATITGMGAYTGSVTKNFSIRRTIQESDFVFDLSTATFDGSPVTGRVTSPTLKEGEDYVVRYLNNDKAGTATIYVVGQGNCTGTISKSFQIVAGSSQEAVKLSKPGKPSLSVGKKSIAVSWKKCTGAASYKVQYRQSGKKTWKSISVKTTKTTLKKLETGKKYQVRIVACGAKGATKTSASVTSKKVK